MDFLSEKADIPQGSKTVALEDSIMQKGRPAGAGSKILDGFIAPFDALVVEKLMGLDIPIAGRVLMDEFGIDGLDFDKAQTLSGAVGAVASSQADYALMNDVFGKGRRRAPLNGVCYIHPTYGTVSRYGLIPVASSMDQIGIVCKDIANGFELLSSIAGKDSRDGAMYPEPEYSYKPVNRKIRMAVAQNAWEDAHPADIDSLSRIKEKFETEYIDLKYFELYKQVLYILSCAELCNNTSRYDGIKFGYRAKNHANLNELYFNTRSEAIGREAKLAIIMGSIILSRDNYAAYYEKAMKIRRLIKDSLCFSEYDVIVMPVRKNGTPYEQSALYALPVLAGLPSISVPYGEGGLQLIAGAKNEGVLYGAWEAAEF